ncbi:MAG TPA: hypothetical protein VK395_21990 [Gemmataceae bacterium]|nr:hypothetical protein [Gemmataceae bacterium]
MLPSELLSGTFWASAQELPLSLNVVPGDLRPRFIPKGRVGRSYRAISRNGRVLLASNVALHELLGQTVRLRIQVWHRSILPGDDPQPYGLLLDARAHMPPRPGTVHDGRLAPAAQPVSVLAVDVGGGCRLAFSPSSGQA